MKRCMAFTRCSTQACATAGSGWPGPFAPLMGIQGMVREPAGTAPHGRESARDRGQAIRINTLNGACLGENPSRFVAPASSQIS